MVEEEVLAPNGSKWPDVVLLKEISETLKLILKEDREWRAQTTMKEESMKRVEEDVKKKMDGFIQKFKESLSPFSELNKTMQETMGPISDRVKEEQKEKEEFLKKIREGLSQN